jgi:hypothetical protein
MGAPVVDLFFKIMLPVLMIGIVTLASHRWGPAVGGVLSAVPAKGGPILIFLAIEQGPQFAATSAAASLGGAGGCGVFCLVYALVCRRAGWPVAGAAAYGAFAAVWAVMLPVSAWGLGAAFVATMGILIASRRLLPQAPVVARRRATALTDLPARMITGAAMVVFVTTAGPYFGATISGMLTTIPTVAAVMALFTHAQEGPDRTVNVMRGLTHGLLGFASSRSASCPPSRWGSAWWSPSSLSSCARPSEATPRPKRKGYPPAWKRPSRPQPRLAVERDSGRRGSCGQRRSPGPSLSPDSAVPVRNDYLGRLAPSIRRQAMRQAESRTISAIRAGR